MVPRNGGDDMPVQRFLGGGWATMHGPADPRALMMWVLDQGFGGVLPGPGPRPMAWRQLGKTHGGLPVTIPAVRVSGLHDPSRLAEAGLCSGQPGDVAGAVAAVTDAVELAEALGCAAVVLEPGVVGWAEDSGPVDLAQEDGWGESGAAAQLDRREAHLNQALDAACRSFHGLTKSFPDVQFCLTPSRHVGGLGDARGLEFLFEDLARGRLRYWHDTAAVACRQARLGEPPGEFLEKFANRLVGMTLGDLGDGLVYLPPGTGGVDYPLLSNYRQRSAKALSAVVELDPGVTPGELPGIHAFLNKFGL
jgi:sugar phosphate isomerase/epimerase